MRLVPWLPGAALAVGVGGASFSSIFIKLLDGVPALVIAFYRLGLTALILAPLALIRYRRELTSLSRRDWLLSGLSGLFLAGHFAAWITSLSYTSVASSVVLVTLQPLFVLAGGYLFYREGTTRVGLAGVAAALVGAAVIGFGDAGGGSRVLLGDALAFLGALLVAGYILVGRSVRQRVGVISYAFVVYAICAGVLLAVSLAMGLPLGGYSSHQWLLFWLLAIVPTIFGHTLFNFALGHLPAAVVSVAILGEPVGASILAAFMLRQLPTPTQLAGGGLILGGLYVFLRFSQGRGGEPMAQERSNPGGRWKGTVMSNRGPLVSCYECAGIEICYGTKAPALTREEARANAAACNKVEKGRTVDVVRILGREKGMSRRNAQDAVLAKEAAWEAPGVIRLYVKKKGIEPSPPDAAV
ncbi:MAG: DMT family transporter [Symbiobacteriia bacterium]